MPAAFTPSTFRGSAAPGATASPSPPASPLLLLFLRPPTHLGPPPSFVQPPARRPHPSPLLSATGAFPLSFEPESAQIRVLCACVRERQTAKEICSPLSNCIPFSNCLKINLLSLSLSLSLPLNPSVISAEQLCFFFFLTQHQENGSLCPLCLCNQFGATI